MRTIKTICLLFLVNFVFTGCVKEEVEEELVPEITTVPETSNLKSISQIISERPELGKLLLVIKGGNLEAKLNSPGNYTVFAPTTTALEKEFGVNFPFAPDRYRLPAVANYIAATHIIDASNKTTDLKTGYYKSLANGLIKNTTLSMYVNVNEFKAVTLNGVANVIVADIPASNGIIHIVNSVIKPLSIVDALKVDPNFKTLYKIITNPEQATTFNLLDYQGNLANSATSEYTVLAPTDIAFSIATGIGEWASQASQQQLSSVLQYHVVSGSNPAGSFFEGQTLITYGTQQLTVSKDATEIKFIDYTLGKAILSKSLSDINCSNGVVHGIDKVLRPKL
jgi:uncharacterized surface protein with fasciclin (FAS1) repeats